MANNTSYAIPKDVTYPEIDKLFPDVVDRICGNCRHWAKIDEYEKKGYCINPDMPAFVDGGISAPVKADFGCVPLWESKESTGKGE